MYTIGIDLGTVYTAAATLRDGRAEIFSLGSRAAVIPSVVLVREDASVLVGEAAVRRALLEPSRVAREFKRRFGDSTPIMLGGSPHSPEALMARLLRSVVADVVAQQGGPPEAVCVCHPANWGPYKTDLLLQAVRIADLQVPVTFAVEPVAAAVHYARQERVPAGSLVAVYDLGGGTFDSTVVRVPGEGSFEIVGRPEGIAHLGGADFDAAVFEHVRGVVGEALSSLDETSPAVIAAVAQLRTECTGAKEALSSDTDTSIPVLLPGTVTEVRLTRSEFERMIRPALYDTVAALQRTVRSAGVTPEDLHSVLLVGGSSRIPLVAQLVGAELGRPVTVDVHPKHAVALGAALIAGTPDAAPTEPVPAVLAPLLTAPSPAPPAPTVPMPTVAAPTVAAPTVPVPVPPRPSPPPTGAPRRPARWILVAAGALVVVAVGVVVSRALQGSSPGTTGGAPGTRSSSPPVAGSANETGVPAAFAGTWSGVLHQPPGAATGDRVTVTLSAGSPTGSYALPRLGCQAVLTVTAVPAGGGDLQLSEQITTDPGRQCAARARLTLTLVPGSDPHQLTAFWQDAADAGNTARGTLTRG